MKKVFLLIATLILFPLLTGCSSKYLEKITVDDLNKKMNDKESFVIYFSNSDNDLEDTLLKVLEKNNIIGYKINTSNISNEEKLNLQTKISYDNPSIVFVIEGNDPSILSHITDSNTSEERITNSLKDMGFIK